MSKWTNIDNSALPDIDLQESTETTSKLNNNMFSNIMGPQKGGFNRAVSLLISVQSLGTLPVDKQKTETPLPSSLQGKIPQTSVFKHSMIDHLPTDNNDKDTPYDRTNKQPQEQKTMLIPPYKWSYLSTKNLELGAPY